MSNQSESKNDNAKTGSANLFGMLDRGSPPDGTEALAAFVAPSGGVFWVLGCFIRFSGSSKMWMRRDGDHQPIPTGTLIGWISLPYRKEQQPDTK